MNRYEVVLFDLDGTITDSAPGIMASIRYALDDLGIDSPDDATMRAFLGPPLMVTFTEHFMLSEADSTRLVGKYRERYHGVGERENAVFPGVAEILSDLNRRGVMIAVATSKPTASATRILEHFELEGYFTFIGGAEMHGGRQHKADVIAHTLEELGIADISGRRIIMVGDREHDVLGAAHFGIPTIGVLWGYGSVEELERAGAAAIVHDAAGLRVELLDPDKPRHCKIRT